MGNTASTMTCAFCQQVVDPAISHDCSQKIFTLINTLATGKNDTFSFDNIDNIIFEGGGVKGIAYLGVLQQLLAEKANFFDDLKRVAGTSAGSMVALYLSLNMTYEEISELMNLDYQSLLDEDVKLKVCTNPTSVISSYKYTIVSIRSVVLSTLSYLAKLQEMIKNPNIPTVKTDMETLFTDIMRYYAYFEGFSYNSALWFIGSDFAKLAVTWLVSFLNPHGNSQLKPPMTHNFTPQTKGTTEAKSQQPNIEQPNSSVPDPEVAELYEVLLHSFQKAAETVKDERTVISAMKAANKKSQESEVKEGTGVNNSASKPQDHESVKASFASSATKNSTSLTVNAVSEVKLEGQALHYALAQLIWFIFVDQKNSDGNKCDLGLFTGNVVKKTLIEAPIQKILAQADISNPNPTFGDLASYLKDGKPLCKPLYITSFNTATLRTEVFSAEHTPNVVVADAVRASMSIPVFFTPVTVNENGEPRRIHYDKGEKSEVIHYMDGGVFDNYAIWLFDDLKYCLQDVLQTKWEPKHKIQIHNPKTLGFKLLDNDRITKYLKPYFDQECTKQVRINNSSFESNFGGVVGTLLSAEINEHEESNYINNGHFPRTVYVDYLGISSVNFSLTDKQKQDLIKSGIKSVLHYKERAKTNFEGEGQTYHNQALQFGIKEFGW